MLRPFFCSTTDTIPIGMCMSMTSHPIYCVVITSCGARWFQQGNIGFPSASSRPPKDCKPPCLPGSWALPSLFGPGSNDRPRQAGPTGLPSTPLDILQRLGPLADVALRHQILPWQIWEEFIMVPLCFPNSRRPLASLRQGLTG